MVSAQKVYVAVSGGVDSSVALALLRDQGYEVTGVYFKTYKPDGDRSYCREQGLSAQRVCEHLGVPFKVFDLQEEYKEKVFEYMLTEYRAGRTPNPDIVCNREVKFGVFTKRAFAEGADMVATGHYARVQNGQLLQARERDKDQTYFLSQVKRDVLARTLFPLGEIESKTEVRTLAEQYGLHTADKPDSQGLCFIGHEMDVKAFLRMHLTVTQGTLLNVRGEVIGTHEGSLLYTKGERHGFTLLPSYQTPETPRLFVIATDAITNTVTVGTESELIAHTPQEVQLTKTNWMSGPPEDGKQYTCRIRHRGLLVSCVFTKNIITFNERPYAPAPGQFAALYDGEVCLGGGVMV